MVKRADRHKQARIVFTTYNPPALRRNDQKPLYCFGYTNDTIEVGNKQTRNDWRGPLHFQQQTNVATRVEPRIKSTSKGETKIADGERNPGPASIAIPAGQRLEFPNMDLLTASRLYYKYTGKRVLMPSFLLEGLLIIAAGAADTNKRT